MVGMGKEAGCLVRFDQSFPVLISKHAPDKYSKFLITDTTLLTKGGRIKLTVEPHNTNP